MLWRLTGDIVAVAADGSGAAEDVIVTNTGLEGFGSLSPAGRWLAHGSERSGRSEIWVRRYPDGVSVRVSPDGGQDPVWSRDGRELFYRRDGAMMAVRVTGDASAGDQFSFDAAVELFDGPFLSQGNDIGLVRSYDVDADGRFLMIQYSDAPEGPDSIVVVQNWDEELRARVPGP